MTAERIRKTVRLFGDLVSVLITLDGEGKYCCELDRQRQQPTADRMYGFGRGETIEEASPAYKDDCHRLRREGV